jgi:hypothetical protein
VKTTGIVRRTRVVVRKVGPWSVLRWSLFFYFCVMLIFFVAAMFVYGILDAAHVLNGISKLLESGGFGCATVPAGQTATCHFAFNSSWIFTRLFLAGVALVVIWSFINLLVAVLYNLVSEILGGIELTLVERR